jgi:AcrR family transcriptional regulator
MRTISSKKRGRPANDLLRALRREAILDAAATIFAQHGYPNTDMQLVADTLHIGKGTIYRYFPTKEHLFLAAVDRGMQRLRQQVQASGQGVADPLQRLAKAIRAYLAFFRDHPEFAELVILERAEFKDRKKQTYFVHRDANAGPWCDLFLDLIKEGRVRDVPVSRIIDVLSDLVYGTMFTNYFAGRHKPLEAQTEDILDIVFHGLLTVSERKRHRSR